MGLQLERECAGTNHVQVPGPVCGAEEVTHSQGGAVPVPQHVPVGELYRFACQRIDQNMCSHQAICLFVQPTPK